MPVSRQMRSSSSCSTSRVMASSAPKGSSISSTSASWASARASATRWRMPPDSSCGRLSAKSVEVHELEQLLDSVLALASRGTPRSLQRQLDVLPRRSATGTAPTPGTSAPAVPLDVDRRRPSGVSSPATRLSSVVLPQPDAPTRQTNSPPCDLERDRDRARGRRSASRSVHLRHGIRRDDRPLGGVGTAEVCGHDERRQQASHIRVLRPAGSPAEAPR